MAVVAEMPNVINVSDFALASTLECGQAFRWSRTADGWFEGVVGKEVWRLRQIDGVLESYCSHETLSREEWDSQTRECDSRLQNYLALDVSLLQILATFPDDPHRSEERRVGKECRY